MSTSWAAASLADSAAPIAIYDLTGLGRHEVLLATATGVHGDAAVLVGLAGTGKLRLVADGQGNIDQLVTADSFGCAVRGAQRLFVVTVAGAGPAGDTSRGSGISHLYFTLSDDLRLRVAGYDGKVLAPTADSAANSAADPLHNDCGTSVPAAPDLYPWASTPQQAVTQLLTAVAAGAATRAAALVGGAFADFSANFLAHLDYEPDVWRSLTALSPGVRQWLDRPVRCMIPDAKALTVPRCEITAANGNELFLELEDIGTFLGAGQIWVVDGVHTGG